MVNSVKIHCQASPILRDFTVHKQRWLNTKGKMEKKERKTKKIKIKKGKKRKKESILGSL